MRSTVSWISGALIIRQMRDILVGVLLQCDASLAMRCRREPGGSELHLSQGNGEVFAFPVYPDYSLCQNRNCKSVTCDHSTVTQRLKLFNCLT